ncbi:hypothetical protein TCAL_05713 [Tigriopus californicus]|uniref:G-protein coupled receptors family 1 profile domain-containing protein n=1 Tax=Tigriopus californicus TaxID=6832 RepID=A0A553N7V8_TIGCA|nr:uncharacterized protein LOC131884482 [Tigriopus californicus]TRY61503.1 hypothetical protein TCAL_05713 [Tigriopus californicus]|eukprot:TCALIF_05713-PA protein Name:"Protein of unknown function" AED:0.03 eAED:0.03 QI:2413/1/0.5/1/0/1/2/0/512
MDNNTQCVILVLLEMGLSFSGIVCNLLVVTTLRQEESLNASTMNFLLLNLCFSNLLISFLVKPISAIYVGYAISTGEWQVGLAFCTLYTFTYRTTWCIFPFSLVAMCWCKLLNQCKCGFCGILCCSRKGLRRSKSSSYAINGMNDFQQNGNGTYTANGRREEMLSLSITHYSHRDGLSPMPSPGPPSAPITEYTLQYRPNRQFTSSSLMLMATNTTTTISTTRGDSTSTPTPSTITETHCHQNSVITNAANHEDETTELMAQSLAVAAMPMIKKKHKRTMEEGPTARQKVLVAFIWLGSAFFGVTTCFPDKVFGVEISQQILQDQLRTIAPSLGTPRGMDLTYCTVKTGVNDILDYIALVVALILPLIIGPGLVGVFQLIFAVFGRFFCQSSHLSQMDLGVANNQNSFFHKKETPGLFAGWGIIIGFTLVFALTYTLHMYVADVYIHDHFVFLLVKYCLGFVFVILVPVITLCLEKEIRHGITSVFGSAVLCLQDISETDNEDQIQVAITEP